MSFLVLDRLDKSFASNHVLCNLSLEIGKGEVLALLGPSGSGKTTTLRLLAGFEAPDAGRILVDGEDVTAMPAARRRFGMVFQHYALFPHLTVGENVGFGLAERGIKGPARATAVARMLEAVDLAGYEARPIASLSGGQQQRVALARALAPEPRVLLLDEPLSNLDPALRGRTRREIRQLIERIGITTVLVTHEQEEAFDLADRIAILNRGRLDQVGEPEVLYRRPATPFVASFIGRSTLLEGQAADDFVRLDPSIPPLVLPGAPAGPVVVAVRPEGFRLLGADRGWTNGRVVERRFGGATAFYRIVLGAALELEVEGDPGAAAVGDTVGLDPTGRGISVFARDGR
jgi:ABC-type Fe3+/spermidine/putrescine transport system ATPase subunit